MFRGKNHCATQPCTLHGQKVSPTKRSSYKCFNCHTKLCTILLKCFVLKTQYSETKNVRSVVQSFVWQFKCFISTVYVPHFELIYSLLEYANCNTVALEVQSNLALRNCLIRNKFVLRNHFLWPICHLLHKDKELLALRNNFRVTKKFLIAKFDCMIGLFGRETLC